MMKILPVPWDVYIPIGASILIAPSFLLLTIAIHYAAPASKRVWTHAGIAFATAYAALVSLVYVTWLFVVEPHVIAHTQDAVAPFVFSHGSFIQMVDGMGYTFMGIAAALTAPVFGGGPPGPVDPGAGYRQCPQRGPGAARLHRLLDAAGRRHRHPVPRLRDSPRDPFLADSSGSGGRAVFVGDAHALVSAACGVCWGSTRGKNGSRPSCTVA
jgi:hypothetical protein